MHVKKAAESARQLAAKELAKDSKAEAERKKQQLQNLQQAKNLRIEAQNLVLENAELQLKFKNREKDLNELKTQLKAEKIQLDLEIKVHNKNSQLLENKAALLVVEKDALENRAFLYSMGFWTSLGAIIFGVITVIIKLPTIKLERQKLRIEIQILEQKIVEEVSTYIDDNAEVTEQNA